MAGDDLDDDLWASFAVPPPPPPPSLGPVCSSSASFYCELEGGPMGAHFDRAAFPSLPVIAVCSSVVLVAVLVASFLLWRHKSKVQNLLPCKNEPPGELGAANGVTYEDVLIHHRGTVPLEILDVKLGERAPPPVTTFYPKPVYEEVSRPSDAAGRSYESGLTSDDDYPSREGSATSSVRGSTGGDLSKDPVSSDGEDCDAPFRYPERTRWPASQENIYSTIDEDELPDYPPVRPPLTSLARPRPPPSEPAVPKSVPARQGRRGHAEDNGSSYGDILPAFDS